MLLQVTMTHKQFFKFECSLSNPGSEREQSLGVWPAPFASPLQASELQSRFSLGEVTYCFAWIILKAGDLRPGLLAAEIIGFVRRQRGAQPVNTGVSGVPGAAAQQQASTSRLSKVVRPCCEQLVSVELPVSLCQPAERW